MRIFDDGIYRDATSEEESLILENTCNATTETDALGEFFTGLASADTNSIAKIRRLAQAFLNAEAAHE